MRDHLVLGMGFVLIAINAGASEPATGGLEGILDQMEENGSSRAARTVVPTLNATPKAPAAVYETGQEPKTNPSVPRAVAPLTEGATERTTQTQGSVAEVREDKEILVFEASRRSALADSPVASGGLESILNTQELKGSMTLSAPAEPSMDIHVGNGRREARLSERLK